MNENEKLVTFLKDLLSFGCLKGFQHFNLFLRGREELLVTIKNFDLIRKEAGEPTETTFLIGSYAKYKCPYVWIRTLHPRLLHLSSSKDSNFDKDLPMKLETTSNWKTQNIKIWNIVAELVNLVIPGVENAFEIDQIYLRSQPKMSKVLNLGALAQFLKKNLFSQ